jgi:hypothetical protein
MKVALHEIQVFGGLKAKGLVHFPGRLHRLSGMNNDLAEVLFPGLVNTVQGEPFSNA